MNPISPQRLAVHCLLLAACCAGQVFGQDEPATGDATVAESLDYGDFSSATLTAKAWEALEAGRYEACLTYVTACRNRYKAKALEMQKALLGPAPADAASQHWALNDVGTGYFIAGQAQEKLGRDQEAIASYRYLLEHLAFSQCWDPKGWFWKPADAARERLTLLAAKPSSTVP